MPRPQDFIAMMDADEIARLQAFVREKYRTLEQTMDHLVAEFGFVDSRVNPDHERAISLSAIHRWKKPFEASDSLKAANEVAREMIETAKREGTLSIADGAILALSTGVFETVLKLQQSGEVTPKEASAFSVSLARLVKAKGSTIEVRAKEREEQAIKAAETAAAKAGATGVDVVAAIKEAMGF